MNLLITLIPFFPLFGFLILGFGFDHIPKKLTSIIGPGTVLLSFIGSVIILFHFIYFPIILGSNQLIVKLFDWITFSGFTVSFSFLIDPLSVVMLLIVTGVGFLIHVYSIGYMRNDPGYNRFFAYMNLFIFFMMLLVMGAGYVIMFIGWEGVGLCSYLLIGFWFKNQEFNNAAKKAFIMNRIGDLGFLLGLFLLFITFGSLNYLDIFSHAQSIQSETGVITVITLLLFSGAIGKSAQIPLYTWLPDAMAGPTPVSALIHAATMVTAGVYMVARSNILFALSPISLNVMAVTGLATAILAASIAIYQNDIKKILAYSTISQLGYMFLGLGVGAFTGAMFHLIAHAFFKALLFLAAGSVIHALGGEQDIRKMGGLKTSLSKTMWIFLIGTITIAGIPPFSGFFSKDEILSAVFKNNLPLWIIAIAGIMMTAFYMFRLFFLTFTGKFRGSEEQKQHLHESPSIMIIPLMVLVILSIAGGVINLPEFMGGSGWLHAFLAPVFATSASIIKSQVNSSTHFSEWVLSGISVICVGVMILAAWSRFMKREPEIGDAIIQQAFLPRLLSKKFYVDELYDKLFVKPILNLSKGLHEVIEKQIIDRFINGIGTLIIRTGNMVRYLQTGHVGFYVFMMVAGIIAILFFNLLI
ncbi:MAG: NADH-quinone oxidoreductase subunit L [Bacteroidales bacterium]|jgi:NADH-quinone oxidoreductase subunit L